MARYIQIPIEVDEQVLAEQAYAAMQERVPGWEPADGNLDVWMLQVVARLAADLNRLATDVTDIIFRYIGEQVVGLQYKQPAYSFFTATINVVDNLGYTIPAGFTVGIRAPNGELAIFQTGEEVVVPPASTSAADVLFVANDPGQFANGLVTTSGNVSIIDPLSWVTSVVGVNPTSGGADGETDEDYMNRLVDEFQLLTPRPIVPLDYARLARRINGVNRAYVVNLWNDALSLANQERCVTVVVTDENGQPVSSGAKTEVDALLQAQREINFLVFVRDPQYQEVDCTFTVRALPNYDTATVAANVTAALTEYLSPKLWGLVGDPNEREPEAATLWRAPDKVRYLEVAQVVNNVAGVDYIEALLVDGGTADVTLAPGSGVPVVLPTPGAITGSANPAS